MTKTKQQTNLPQFTIRQLLEAGVHFGHKTRRRNTKMSKYIYGARNGISIIDLRQTAKLLQDCLKVAKGIAKNNGRILFVATKKQGCDVVADAARRCGQYYVNNRWLGGMLTNWKTISASIKTLTTIENQLADESSDLNKKEKLMLERKREKLDSALGGIRSMGGYPDLVFVIDVYKENLAIAEAKKLGVPIMAVLDSSCNPDGITYPIPGNDDSVKSIRLYSNLLADAILAGIEENMSKTGVNLEKVKKDSDKKPAAKTVKALDKTGGAIKISDKKVESVKKEDSPKVEKAIVEKAAPKKTVTKKAEEKKPEAKKVAKKADASGEKKPVAKKPAAKKTAEKKKK